jgi:hypothetical protein
MGNQQRRYTVNRAPQRLADGRYVRLTESSRGHRGMRRRFAVENTDRSVD